MISAGQITDPMDNWERVAVFAHLVSPLLLGGLIILAVVFDGGLLVIIFTLPLLFLSIFNDINFVRFSYQFEALNYTLSAGIIVFTIFFPYLLLISSISIVDYTVLYLTLQVPLFLGHVYSVIYYLTSSNQDKLQKINSGP